MDWLDEYGPGPKQPSVEERLAAAEELLAIAYKYIKWRTDVFNNNNRTPPGGMSSDEAKEMRLEFMRRMGA